MKLIFLLFILCIPFSYGQETKSQNLVQFNHDIRLNVIIPSNFGANFLAESYDSKVGIGTNFSFLRINNFKLGAGYDFISYIATDITRTGNIKGAQFHTAYGDIAYEIKITENLNLEPYIGYGGAKLKFKSDGRDFGNQDGNNFRIGFNTDYKLGKRFSGFVGVCYLQSKLNINTSPEFVSFYDNTKMFQLNIGLKIH